MVEYGGGFEYAHRQSLTTSFGTVVATILGPAPPQMMYEITEVVVTGPTNTEITGRLMQFATLPGYSQYGTVLGTIVEPFHVGPSGGNGGCFLDGNGSAPVAYVDPGCLLYGVVDSGSVSVKIVYRPINARGW